MPIFEKIREEPRYPLNPRSNIDNYPLSIITTVLTIIQKKSYYMKFSTDKNDRYTVFSLLEEHLNSLNAPNLKSEFVLLNNEGVSNLIFDLSATKFVDSSGLSAILTANRLWKDEGLFILTGVNHPAVKKLIEISQLETILTVLQNVEEAVDYVFIEEIERDLRHSDED